jgi:beta-phosphoglucomutase
VTRISALLVDMDGTLIDTAHANFLAYRDALAEAEVRVERAAFDQIADGRNWRQFLPELMQEATQAELQAVAARKAQIYPSKLDATRVNGALVRLIENGRPAWRTALVTTASAVNVQAVLAHHRLEHLFDTIVTGTDVKRHKPDPEAYLLAAERLAVAPADCLIFEDSDVGAASAVAFGAPYIRLSFPPSDGPATSS